ncbi:hypothetical protein PC110_g8016 [Phytophthora cactorum]|uniref:Tc1-like transposase DDE domain-containing protein n=1 Tax=Phytophthora cactorum TaxID=29920 RepID=A0A329SFQ0_9STRA|nr:hypothetical protein PC117_g5887 [Phytophthora cactorum]RAW35667.1 hypothetical protein PC110_g8016 [Phytophthora cactorum]
MPSLYNRYSLQIKLRILEAARSGGDWELIAETNNVNINTARSWLHCYPKTSDVLHPRPRGGKQQQKMTTNAVTYLLSELSIDPDLTLIQLADKFDTQCAISVCPQTITHHLDGNLIIMKQFHKEPQYMNAEVNKFKRRESLIRLQELQAMGKSIIYMDKTNFNMSSSPTRGRRIRGRRAVKKVLAGGGQNLQVIACIGKGGAVHYETKLEAINISIPTSSFGTLCAMFAEPDFQDATLLRLGPYSPMLNLIENVFSAFKSKVKGYVTEHRLQIIAVAAGNDDEGTPSAFSAESCADFVPRVATAQLCASCYRHTLTFHVKVTDLEDIPVGR